MTGYDLHTHSTCSDGTNTITENVKLGLERGLTGIAITDHDTTDGYEEAVSAADGADLEIVTGIEFSAEYEGASSALKNADHLHDLIASGLDEERFHPLPGTWKNMEKSPIKKTIKNIVDTSADIAIEIPALPKMQQETLALISWAESQGVRWINLNELEFSERNSGAFLSRGYQLKNDISAGVKGSEQIAIKIIKMAQKKDLNIGLHYCSVSFKDGVQLKNRIKRRAKHIAKPYDVITKDGTLIKGTIYSVSRTYRHLSTFLQKTYNVPSHLLFIDIETKTYRNCCMVATENRPKINQTRISLLHRRRISYC